MKKIIAILVTISMLVCLSSCTKIKVTVPNKTNPSGPVNDDFSGDNGQISDDFSDLDNQGGSIDNTQNDVQNDTPPSGELSDNPSEWTKAQIVDYYKNNYLSINEGQYLLIRFENNSWIGNQKGYSKMEFMLTNLLICAQGS